VFHVPFDRFNEIRDQVMPPGKLYVDLRKRVADTVAFIDQAVVYADRPEHNRGDNAQEYQE
jgi:hypothetical protein